MKSFALPSASRQSRAGPPRFPSMPAWLHPLTCIAATCASDVFCSLDLLLKSATLTAYTSAHA